VIIRLRCHAPDGITDNHASARGLRHYCILTRREIGVTIPTMPQRKEIWIEWGGRTYGPYPSAAAALKDGFHLPEGD
jgi:hypothetical protein